MARTEGDTWDLASSVGATATMVAAARAVATNSADPVIDDPFAAPLVRAVGIDFFTKLVDGQLTAEDLDNGSEMSLTRFANAMAARTRFFDDFYMDSTSTGIRQAVILAAGLDSRAYRLAWPAGTVVFEIDQPQVIEFKSATLAGLGAEPTTDRRAVAADLRDDWAAELQAAGFDPGAPTAWIAEGLFGYLPPEAQNRLLDQITELSAPGSRLGAEGVPNAGDIDPDVIRERMQAIREQWGAHGFDLDFSELVFMGDRADVITYLDGHGWSTTGITGNDLLETHGLPRGEQGPGVSEVTYYTAQK